MKDLEYELTSEVKLNTLAKTIYNESIEMGFKSNDYVKLMNELLDMTIKKEKTEVEKKSEESDILTISTDLPIKTKNLILRYYNSEKDRKIVSKWFEDINNRLFLLSTTTKHNLDIDQLENSEDKVFAMITLLNNTPIGLLALLNIDKENSKAEMRKMIADIKYRGKGYAKEATGIWLKFCTEYLNLNKIYINTVETNIKNVKINRQLGLHIEGLLKKEFKIDDVEHDVLRMAYFRR